MTVTVGDPPTGVYVEDGGPGIQSDVRDDVLDCGYAPTETGTGFGLSIIRDVAKAHGWQLEVISGTDWCPDRDRRCRVGLIATSTIWCQAHASARLVASGDYTVEMTQV